MFWNIRFDNTRVAKLFMYFLNRLIFRKLFRYNGECWSKTESFKRPNNKVRDNLFLENPITYSNWPLTTQMLKTTVQRRLPQSKHVSSSGRKRINYTFCSCVDMRRKTRKNVARTRTGFPYDSPPFTCCSRRTKFTMPISGNGKKINKRITTVSSQVKRAFCTCVKCIGNVR